MSKFKISEEVACDQLGLLLDFYELDFTIDDILNSDGRNEQYDSVVNPKSLKKFLLAIRKGRLEIKSENDLKIIQYLKFNNTENNQVVYRPIEGSDKSRSIRKNSEDNPFQAIYEILGKLSGLGATTIEKFKGPDIRLAEDIGIFLSNA